MFAVGDIERPREIRLGKRWVTDKRGKKLQIAPIDLTLRELRHEMSDARHRGEALIVRPRCDSRAGHPVGFSCEYFSELMSLRGDDGARPVVEAHAAELEHLDTSDRGVLTDIDRP